MELIGKTTIHPVLFFSGKTAGYAVWVVFAVDACGLADAGSRPADFFRIFGVLLAAVGLLFVAVSLFNLGRSTRLGLPGKKTELKAGGLYRISRNPMYLGFDLLTIGGACWMGSLWPILAGAYSIAVYHLIILGEERFLAGRFGSAYAEYSKRVGRYI